MKFDDIIKIIEAIAVEKIPFADAARTIAQTLGTCVESDLALHLEYAAVIPERFDHDSTEEKLYAKYCDALLAEVLKFLGLRTTVIAERADAADVQAESSTYRLVGDAKAFRLSRTAKNQKDFKITALSQWRRGAEYACLVAPRYQYPTKASQIYEQAIRDNVTLLSYTHLRFLLERGQRDPEALKPLWEVSRTLVVSKSAELYWGGIERALCEVTGCDSAAWRSRVTESMATVPAIAEDNIRFWENERRRIESLSHADAIATLLEALKIASKIKTIRERAVEVVEDENTLETAEREMDS